MEYREPADTASRVIEHLNCAVATEQAVIEALMEDYRALVEEGGENAHEFFGAAVDDVVDELSGNHARLRQCLELLQA